MKTNLGLVTSGMVLALLAPVAAAQSLVASSNSGAVVAPGATAPQVLISVRDANGVPRSGVTVTFDAQCTYRQRGEIGPYACVTTAGPLDVVSDSVGNVMSPIYQADGFTGNAWVTAIANIDGRLAVLPFYFTIGTGPITPLRIVSGDGQVVQLGFTAEPLIGRVVDDFGRGMAGVPVTFVSDCSGSLPCLLAPTGGARLVSDGQGYVDSGARVANSVSGSYAVPLSIVGVPGGVSYSLQNIPPTRSAISKTRTGAEAFIRITEAPDTCAITRWQPLNDTLAAPAPFMLAVPQGLIELFIDNCPAGAEISFQLQHPGGFPEGSRIWTVRPAWQPRDSVNPIEGFWEFALTDGAAGDADEMADGSIRTVVAVGYGDPAAPDYQDLWWVGYEENGWGISIVQHGDVLFVIVFAYDAQGQPTWYVMPGGSWNATRDTYSGVLYSPRGRPHGEHMASNLVVGAPVGTLLLTFYDTMNARAAMRFGGTETIKLIERQFFGVRDERVTGRYGDIWWAGAARSGWGFVLQQQYASMFALMFTYGTDGKPVWYTMPSITQTSNEVFRGPVHKTASSPWPAGYDPNLLVAPDVGEFRVEFTGGGTGATFDFIAEGRTNRFTISRQPF
jgi:hypothetical protein